MSNVLAIHAHPDDVEILCAGTLALLRRSGANVTIATMTPGDLGSAELPPDEIARIRRSEAAASAAIIGAAYHCLEFRDLAIFPDAPSRRRVAEFLRSVQPDVVITASPTDYLCDHEATSVLVRDACFAAPIPHYSTGAPLSRIPHLYFMDPIGGVDREGREIAADFYVDVAPTFDIKRSMLAKHDSQRAWLRVHHDMDDYLDQMERWTRARGAAAGFTFAEGFRRYKGHPFPQTDVLRSLLLLPSRAR